MNIFFPENTNIQLSCQATTAYVHKQVQKDFTDHSKILVQINNGSKLLPNRLFLTIHGTAVVTNPEGYIIVYGIKDWSDSVDPTVYDSDFYTQMFEYKNDDMFMNTNIDLNNHKIKNVPQPRNATDLLTKQSVSIFDIPIYGTIDRNNNLTSQGISIGFSSVYIVKITLINKNGYQGVSDKLIISHNNVNGVITRLNYPFRFPPGSGVTVITINRLFLGEVIRIISQTSVQIPFVLTYRSVNI